MKIYKSCTILSILVLLILFLVPISLKGKDALVKKVKAETTDGIAISMWVEQQAIRSGQNVIIKYKVENNSNASIYLIHQDSFDTVTEQDTVRIGAPVPPPDPHGGYDYNFINIAPKKNYQDQLTISKDRYMRDERYNMLPLRIEMGFAYVRDIKGLNRQLNIGEDPAALRGLLSERAITLLLSGISIEVNE